MKFEEHQIRGWARRPDAYFEMEPFIRAFKSSPPNDEFVVVNVVVRGEEKTIELEREHLEDCVRWINDEWKPERELLEYVKPEMRRWITENRDKMVDKVKEAIDKKPEHWQGCTIVWPITTPDVIPIEIAKDYVKTYGLRS